MTRLELIEFPSAEVFLRRLMEPRVAAEPRGVVHGPEVTTYANSVHGFLVVEQAWEVRR